MWRLAAILAILAGAALAQAEAEETVVAEVIVAETLEEWLDGFRPRALDAGISAVTLDAALPGLEYLPVVVDRDRNQNEFTKTIWDYLSTAVSDARIQNGQAKLAANTALFDEIEAAYGVDRHIIAAIWGLESAYGAVRGDTSTLSALATLAFDGRRGAFFEAELIAALTILDNGDTTPDRMRGSWAGAMGHTQFMPSSFLALAVDFRGDGKRNIWEDDPTDALASAARYLQNAGWVTGQPWGVEVNLPERFDYTLADRRDIRLPSAWAEIGIRDTDGNVIPDHGMASILLPAGALGSAFMIFDNFAALETYNTADAYVIAVGHLADRLSGGGPIEGGWPLDDRALTFAERQELQRGLTEAGHSTQGIDGLIGPNTVNAIRSYQLANDLIPDGYAAPALLERFR
ncbi:lytic murein transglycosylase [Flavimaricola marinus]|uniref:Membrane-bound lytic murein transglycosylase B n=1 Tax=Flavimaricola marinus TaxID=1819565 RepID=A0A238LGV0_9RHOB|nr:lytic murein transglycosylase [Flavimaricola marinus]SMY08120.1 Membrane-bound lytic murein transglycosylase B precursor [Flavimaricola marinus]